MLYLSFQLPCVISANGLGFSLFTITLVLAKVLQLVIALVQTWVLARSCSFFQENCSFLLDKHLDKQDFLERLEGIFFVANPSGLLVSSISMASVAQNLWLSAASVQLEQARLLRCSTTLSLDQIAVLVHM